MAVNVVLTVKGMTCSHCEQTIKEIVAQLQGVQHVDVQLKQEQVTLEYDNNDISLETICATIEEHGYDVIQY